MARMNVCIMDGGMGRELTQRGVRKDEQIWSAIALVEEEYHTCVKDVHKSFIEAGAQTITTCNYGVQPRYYQAKFPDDWEARIAADTATAARLAVEARSELGRPDVRIFGCLPPVESHRPDVAGAWMEQNKAVAEKFYRETGEALVRAGVDVLIAETMNSWEEAEFILRIVAGLGKPLVVSMEGGLRGADLTARPSEAPSVARKALAFHAEVPLTMFGFNCSTPEDLLAAFQAMHDDGVAGELRTAGVEIGAYANLNEPAYLVGFDLAKCSECYKSSDPRAEMQQGYVDFVRSFLPLGVTHVGGCCGCGPDIITLVAKALSGEA